MEKEYFDFSEALAFMKAGMKVGCKDGLYWLKDTMMYVIYEGDCIEYEIEDLFLDEILSNKWFLINE